MLKYIVKQTLYSLLVLWGVITILFVILNLLPSPERMLSGQRTDVSSAENIRKQLGLDKTPMQRYLAYMNNLLPITLHEDTPEKQAELGYTKLFGVGDMALVIKAPYLGRSYQRNTPVSEILAEKIPPTVILAITSIILALLLGIPFGILAALKHNRWPDDAVLSLSVFGISQPSYVVALVLAFILAVQLKEFTGLSVRAPLYDYENGEQIIIWSNLIIPTLALGIRPVAIIMQMTRSSMLDVMSSDYIRTAKAKGLSNFKVIGKHTLRNALNPVLTSASGWFAGLLAGSVLVETVVDYKGLGSELLDSLMFLDLPVLMGIVLFIAVVYVVVNILTDIGYAVLDPRVRHK